MKCCSGQCWMLNRLLVVQQTPCLQAEATQLTSRLLRCCSQSRQMLKPLEQVQRPLLQQGCAWLWLRHLYCQLLLRDLQAHTLMVWRLQYRAQEWDAGLCGTALA